MAVHKDDVAKNEEFRKQGVDVMTCDHDNWADNLSKDPVIAKIAVHHTYDHTGLGYSFIAWNCRKAPFDDARVRRAMTMLTDRKTILEQLERGQGTIAVCLSKRIYPEYSNDIEPWPFDIEAARKLLADAGWKDTNGDGILDRDGKDFEFEFKYPTPRRFYVRVGALLRDACKRVGIRMTEAPLEWSVFYQQFKDRQWEAVCLLQLPVGSLDGSVRGVALEPGHPRREQRAGVAHEGIRRAAGEMREESTTASATPCSTVSTGSSTRSSRSRSSSTGRSASSSTSGSRGCRSAGQGSSPWTSG